MTNGSNALCRLYANRESLRDFLDWLIESKCCDAALISAVSTSLCLISTQHNKYAVSKRKNKYV